MKINLHENFTKYVGSKMKAIRLVNKIAANYNDRADSCTIRKSGRYILEVRGTQKNFKWNYYGDQKTLQVYYTDGRSQPEPVKPKNTYYIIWVEGLSPENGEKIKSIDLFHGVKYTVKMTEALRVREKHLPLIKEIMKLMNIANFVTDSPRTYVKTHYAPAGTLFRS
jgi:hypothetical protein